MARDFSKMTPQELEAIYQANYGQGKQSTQTTQQDPSQVASILKSLQLSPMQSVGNAMSVLGGGKPIYEEKSGLDNIYKQAQIAALTKKANTPGATYFTLDDQGNAVPVEGVAPGAKPVPVGYTPNYQSAAENRGNFAAAGVPLRQAQTVAAETGNKVMQQYLPGADENNPNTGNLPPGTTINAGPMNIPLNPQLNDAQTAAISGVQTLDPIVAKIEKSLDAGIYDKGGGNVGRTLRQFGSNTKMPLLTSMDPELQSLQSDLNTLKKTIPFTEGGKQLTPFEAKQVFALLDTTGKNNPQIKNDLNQAMAILRSKERLAIGGRNAALQGQQAQPIQLTKDYSTMTDEELHKIASGQ